MPADESRVPQLPSNQNLQVKTNRWQFTIIGINWTTLCIQICCLLSTSQHINNLSSRLLGAAWNRSKWAHFSWVSGVSQKSKRKGKKKSKPHFRFATIRESSLIRPISVVNKSKESKSKRPVCWKSHLSYEYSTWWNMRDRAIISFLKHRLHTRLYMIHGAVFNGADQRESKPQRCDC